ncbi:MAG: hypothetical protein M2R45_02883 [Verrucomicrobia subdivision 3 bacterium]|nr:hypothetical protein [Limisphaerales bacterium]MCS1414735.1 hypothetical protein [Limisphaerales bacterium]
MTEFFVDRVWSIWTAGGWTMMPLCFLSILIYSSAIKLFLYFSKRDCYRIPEAIWSQWVMDPKRGEGEIGEIIRYTQDEAQSLDEIHSRFVEVVASRIPYIDRNITFTNILVTAAPLIGLLGTVMGMLMTFQSIGAGSGEMAGMMAKGISAALFPPEVGLCVALPGLMMVQMLKRKRDEYQAFLAHLETRTVQQYKKPGTPSGPVGDPVTEPEPEGLSGLDLSPVAG